MFTVAFSVYELLLSIIHINLYLIIINLVRNTDFTRIFIDVLIWYNLRFAIVNLLALNVPGITFLSVVNSGILFINTMYSSPMNEADLPLSISFLIV